MSTTTVTPRNPFLDLIPDAAPEEQLRSLKALGLLPQDLLAASRSLYVDLGEAILAMPIPLGVSLALLDTAQAETALLGFTIQDVLNLPTVANDPRTENWNGFPPTLLGLIQDNHPHILQVLYLGAVINFPSNPSNWKKVARVMKAVDHLGAFRALAAPAIQPLSYIYDQAPGTPGQHPFLFFTKEGF